MKKFANRHNECIKVDGKEYWISRSVAVVALVNVIVDGKSHVLINQRGPGTPDFQGYWNLPCGYLDWDESGIQAAKREIYEETGLDIDKYDFKYNEQPVFVITDKINNKQNVTLYYNFTIKTNEYEFALMKVDFNMDNSEKEEVSDIQFIEPKNVSKYKFCFSHEIRIKELLGNKCCSFKKFFLSWY